ncbi:MAG: ABC transporter substrate-binding protein [Flavobacteriales bacterium]
MKKTIQLLWFVASTIGIVSCNDAVKMNNRSEIVSSLKPKWANGFEIQTLGDSTRRIILFNLEKANDTLQVIEWKPQNIERVACLSTTHIAMLQQLNMLSTLKGVGFANLVQNKAAKAKIENGEITNLTTSHDVDAEVVFSLNPQAFFVYPFGGTTYVRYEQKGLPVVQISEYLETHPLGRAEWIRVFGAIMNQEQLAQKVFAEIESAYLHNTALVAKSIAKRPTVFTGFYDSGNWFAPPGNSFAAQLLKDAGADYIFADSLKTSNLIIPFETMLTKAYLTDWWGKILHDEDEVTQENFADEDERLMHLNSFKQQHLFYCNTAHSDYHGDAVLQPQLMLQDLITIFHPALLANHTVIYFKPIKPN